MFYITLILNFVTAFAKSKPYTKTLFAFLKYIILNKPFLVTKTSASLPLCK